MNNLAGKTILIVDDRAMDREFLVTLLGYVGYKVLEAADGAEALAMARAMPIDLIITDILMPIMSGDQLVRELRADPATARIPIFLYTATYRIQDIKRMAQSFGVNTIIAKPAEPQLILDKVNQLLGSGQDPIPTLAAEHTALAAGLDYSMPLHLPLGESEQGEGGNDDPRQKSKRFARSLLITQALSLRLFALVDLALDLTSEKNITKVTELFCRAAQDIMDSRYVAIAVFDSGNGQLCQFITRGMEPVAAKKLQNTLDPRAGIFGEVLADGKPRRLQGLGGRTASLGLPIVHPPINTLLIVPVRIASRTSGWLYLADKMNDAVFSDEDQSFASMLAAQLALAHENHHLYQDVLQKEERFHALVEAATDAIITACHDGIIQFCNAAARKMFGYDTLEIVGRPLTLLMPGRYRQAHLRGFQRVLATGEKRVIGRTVELHGQRRDGSEFPIELSLAEWNCQEHVHFTAIIRDITVRKQAENEISDLNADLEQRIIARTAEIRAIVDNQFDAIITIDARGIIRSANLGLERLLGYTSADVIGHNVSMLMPEPYHSGHDAYLDRYLRTGESRIIGVGREVEGLHKDGQTIIPLDLAINEYVVHDEHFFVGTLRDIRERKQFINELTQAKEIAEQANRAKSAFLATMSHEIRTPMNGVIGMVEVLQHDNLTQYQQDTVKIIHDSALALMEIIDNILDFSKIEAGRLELERVPVAVMDFVESICTSQVPVAASKGVDLSLFITPRLAAQALFDQTRLRQILYNMISNAIKFSGGRPHQRGRVDIRVEIADAKADVGKKNAALQRLVFTFADNGIGIAPEMLDHLFQPFTQAEVSTTRRYGGTGLGLTICQRLVHLMGGDINVHSIPGQGSTFIVTLPYEAFVGREEAVFPALEDLDCIVVAGAEFNANDLRIYLEQAGARVEVVADLYMAARQAANLAAPVVIQSVETDTIALHAAFSATPQTRHLLITRGRRRRARVVAPGMVILDGNLLFRQVLLQAVALAAGRILPETEERSLPLHAGVAPLTIAEARLLGRLVLVAEDDEVNQKVILRQLALLGYAAEIADNGKEALRLWRDGHYDLLLTDLHMPEMDGYALTEAIRREEIEPGSPPRRRMPILALTANALRGESDRAFTLGMDGYLTKPAPLHVLQAALEKWLPHRNELPSLSPPKLPSTDTTVSVLDVAVLQNLVGNDTNAVLEFLTAYLTSTRQRAVELRAACATGDSRQVGAIAHKLKSSSRAVGALILGDLCAALEIASKDGAQSVIAQEMQQFEAALTAVEAKIVELLGEQFGEKQ